MIYFLRFARGLSIGTKRCIRKIWVQIFTFCHWSQKVFLWKVQEEYTTGVFQKANRLISFQEQYTLSLTYILVQHTWIVWLYVSVWMPWITDGITNRCGSFYMSLCASCFAAPLVAVRLNYKFVTKSCVFTDHFNQSNFHFCDNINGFIYFRYIILMSYIS